MRIFTKLVPGGNISAPCKKLIELKVHAFCLETPVGSATRGSAPCTWQRPEDVIAAVPASRTQGWARQLKQQFWSSAEAAWGKHSMLREREREEGPSKILLLHLNAS